MKKNKTLIIAEAGVNHNGELKLAKRLVLAAKKAGADIVKFQSFTAENLVTSYADKASYQKQTTKKEETHFEMLKKLELDSKSHFVLKKYCQDKGIEFLSSAFDVEGLKFLGSLKLRRFKAPSGEITNLPYLRTLASFNKKTILSTGMASMKEIADSLDVLYKHGLSKEKITLLQCNTEYPTPTEDVNLNAMSEMEKKFNIAVGYSDHSQSTILPAFAVVKGAKVIEKHITLDKKMPGPDHSASLCPEEFTEMVKHIRNAEISLGSNRKLPTSSEKKNIPIVRKSIVAKKNILKGEIFSEDNLTTKRPATGISPMKWDKIIGKRSKKDYHKDQLITY